MIDKHNDQPNEKPKFQPQLQLALAHARAHVRTLQTDSQLEAAARAEVTSHLKTMNRPHRKRRARRRASKHRLISKLSCDGNSVDPKRDSVQVIEEYRDFKYQMRPEAEDYHSYRCGSRFSPSSSRNGRKQPSKLVERRTVAVHSEVIEKSDRVIDPPGRYTLNVAPSSEHNVLSFKDQANDRFDLASVELTEGSLIYAAQHKGASKARQDCSRLLPNNVLSPPLPLAIRVGNDRTIVSKDDCNLFCFSILW